MYHSEIMKVSDAKKNPPRIQVDDGEPERENGGDAIMIEELETGLGP